MKLVLCCNKSKPYLVQGAAKPMHTLSATNPFNFSWKLVNKGFSNDRLNGKIIVECDFEVEPIFCELFLRETIYGRKPEYLYYTKTSDNIEEALGLPYQYIDKYLEKNSYSYALRLTNIHIFDKPKELFDYSRIIETPYGEEPDKDIKKTPKTMISCCYLENDIWKKAFMLSRTSQELCKILNGEQTTIILKRIPEEIKPINRN